MFPLTVFHCDILVLHNSNGHGNAAMGRERVSREREREGGPGASNVVHAAGPAESDGGWSDVIVHTRIRFLSSCGLQVSCSLL